MLRNTNIARGTTDPGIASITWIRTNSKDKIDEKAQTAKFTVLQGEISSAVLKTWKTRETKT